MRKNQYLPELPGDLYSAVNSIVLFEDRSSEDGQLEAVIGGIVENVVLNSCPELVTLQQPYVVSQLWPSIAGSDRALKSGQSQGE